MPRLIFFSFYLGGSELEKNGSFEVGFANSIDLSDELQKGYTGLHKCWAKIVQCYMDYAEVFKMISNKNVQRLQKGCSKVVQML